MIKTTVHYALKCRNNNLWLSNDGYNKFNVASEAKPLARLATARSHRLRALLDKPNLGIIDIHQVMISIDVRDVIVEDSQVQDRLMGLLNATNKFRFISYQASVPDYVSLTEHLIRHKAENVNMRYVAVCLTNEDARILPKVDVKLMKQVARFVRKGGVFLIRDTADLAAMRLFEGFKPAFVYDFQSEMIIDSSI